MSAITTNLSIDELKHAISPEQIAYFSEGGSIGIQSIETCKIIRTIRDAAVLQELLEHSRTLRAPHGKEFPIHRVRSAIAGRLEEFKN